MSLLHKIPRTVIILIFRLVLGALFILAGSIKILAPVEFAKAIVGLDMPLVPIQAANLIAIIVPWLEIVIGVLLVMGIWIRAAATLLSLLLVGFIIIIAQAMARGLKVDCGCFGKLIEGFVGWGEILRNSLMLFASGWLSLRVKD